MGRSRGQESEYSTCGYLRCRKQTCSAVASASRRKSASFRDGIVKIAATKVSAGVSTGIGDHEEKYEGKKARAAGDEQFEIADARSLAEMYAGLSRGGLQPVLNDYVYV